MPGRGPAPKPQRSRERDTKASTTIPANARAIDPPALPDRPDGEPWTERTLDWYARWSRSPQATLFTPTDWGRLHDLALVYDQFVETGDYRRLAEIRQNETLLGATHLDRTRLRWSIEQEEAAPKARRASRRDPRLRAVK